MKSLVKDEGTGWPSLFGCNPHPVADADVCGVFRLKFLPPFSGPASAAPEQGTPSVRRSTRAVLIAGYTFCRMPFRVLVMEATGWTPIHRIYGTVC